MLEIKFKDMITDKKFIEKLPASFSRHSRQLLWLHGSNLGCLKSSKQTGHSIALVVAIV